MRTRFPSAASLICLLLMGLIPALAACAPSTPSIPPADQFTQPAIGTPIARITDEVFTVPSDSGGVAIYNQQVTPIRVAIDNTITTITPTQGFLFVVSPGSHDFYVYETNGPASIRSEQVEAGKIRYVYLLPLTMQDK